jgi:hypothetical protein
MNMCAATCHSVCAHLMLDSRPRLAAALSRVPQTPLQPTSANEASTITLHATGPAPALPPTKRTGRRCSGPALSTPAPPPPPLQTSLWHLVCGLHSHKGISPHPPTTQHTSLRRTLNNNSAAVAWPGNSAHVGGGITTAAATTSASHARAHSVRCRTQQTRRRAAKTRVNNTSWQPTAGGKEMGG